MAEDSRGPYTGKWFDDRNERRKMRYAEDPEYRAKANKSARQGYRNVAGVKPPADPTKNMHMLDRDNPECVGSVREVKGREYPALTYSKAELALIFERPTKQVQQWSAGNDRRIPSPILKGRIPGKERMYLDVYTEGEARAIVETLAPFLKDMIYFRCDHREPIDACRAAVAKVRRRMVKP